MSGKWSVAFVAVIGLALLVMLALSLATSPAARAASITVNSTADTVADDGECTLREAIIAANTDAASGGAVGECAAGFGADSVDLTGVTGSIHLTGSLPDITSDVIITGPGDEDLIVRRNSGGEYRIWRVGITATVTLSGMLIETGQLLSGQGGGIYNAGTLTLTHCTLRSCNAYLGGGIYNLGTLTLIDSTVRTCGAEQGGGINNDQGTLRIISSTVEANLAFSGGGAIANVGGSAASATLTNATVSANDADYGGGVFNDGALTLVDSAVSDNDTNSSIAFSGHGGGIYNAIGGTLMLTDSIVSGNTVSNLVNDGYGGGIYNAGALALNNSTLRYNQTYGDHCHGGGIHNAGTLTLTNSAIAGNNASTDLGYGDGGGVYNDGGSIVLESCIVSSNSSNGGGSGGGLWNGDGGSMELKNSTVTFNNAYGSGGGIYNTDNSTLTLNHSTIGGFNYAFGSDGGGLWNDTGGTVHLKNSIVAGNSARSGGPDCYNAAALTSLGYNLVGDDHDCSFTPQTGDQANVDPRLGPLRDNGGPTETRALLNGSPGIDAIPGDSCTDHQGMPITTDQRGVARPQGVACDVGAYEELESVDLSLTKTVDEAGPYVGDNVVFTIQATNNGPLVASGVVISDLLPADFTFVSSHTSRGIYTGDTGAWNVGRLGAGLSATLTLTTTVHAGAVGRVITNTAEISAVDQFDSQPDNNSAVAAITGIEAPIAGLALTSDSPTPLGQATTLTATVTTGSNVTYTWAFGDGSTPLTAGGDPAGGVVVTHTYPAAGVYAAVVTASNSVGVLTDTIAVSVLAEYRVFLPSVVRNYIAPVTFPLHIGDAISGRPVAYQGEVFYVTSVQMPGELPPKGCFYFSSQRDAVTEAVVDDELALSLEGVEVWAYDFATGDIPEPVILEMPRTVLEGLAGRIVGIEYRDVYGVLVQASEMWLIWTP